MRKLILAVVTVAGLAMPTSAAAVTKAPVVSSKPTVSGKVAIGGTVYTNSGAWSWAPTSYTYQWADCASTCTPISGATGESYVVQASDAGKALVVTVTASNTTGSTSATSAQSVTVPGPAGSCNGDQSWAASTQTATNQYIYSPLSDQAAITCATALGDTTEAVSGNSSYNSYLPSASELSAFESAKDDHGATPTQGYWYPQYVTGGCAAGQGGHPTTDFLIDCTAFKWGIPADWLRAQYTQESDWRMTQLGDRRTETAACFAQYPPQAQISGTDVYESMGISQVKWRCDGSDGAGTEPLRWKSTAFNMDYEASIVRFSYDNPNGDRSSWGDSTYQPQQQWLSIGSWFESYPWNNSGQQSYVSSVQTHLSNRDWP